MHALRNIRWFVKLRVSEEQQNISHSRTRVHAPPVAPKWWLVGRKRKPHCVAASGHRLELYNRHPFVYWCRIRNGTWPSRCVGSALQPPGVYALQLEFASRCAVVRHQIRQKEPVRLALLPILLPTLYCGRQLAAGGDKREKGLWWGRPPCRRPLWVSHQSPKLPWSRGLSSMTLLARASWSPSSRRSGGNRGNIVSTKHASLFTKGIGLQNTEHSDLS